MPGILDLPQNSLGVLVNGLSSLDLVSTSIIVRVRLGKL